MSNELDNDLIIVVAITFFIFAVHGPWTLDKLVLDTQSAATENVLTVFKTLLWVNSGSENLRKMYVILNIKLINN